MTSIVEAIKEAEEGIEQEIGWMPMPQLPGQQGAGPDPERLQRLAQILRENPIMIEPTLNWVLLKTAEINKATLDLLYTPEQLEEKRKQLENLDE